MIFANLINDTYDNLADLFQEFEDILTNPLTNLLMIVVVLWLLRRFGMLILTRAIRKGIQRDNYASEQDEQKREKTIISIVDAIFRVAIWIFGSMLILAQLGVDIGPLIAGVSFAGIAVGFGAQSLVKDFVSGIFIIMENQYRVGDVVELAGVSGTVEAITMRQTVLRDLDGNQHHIPNGSIDVATNKSFGFSRININLGVAYDTDITKAEEVINKVGQDMATDEKWRDKIVDAPTFRRVQDFGASEVTLKIIGKVQPGKQWAVAGEFRGRIKQAFDKHQIEIPFPQLVTHAAKPVKAAGKQRKK